MEHRVFLLFVLFHITQARCSCIAQFCWVLFPFTVNCRNCIRSLFLETFCKNLNFGQQERLTNLSCILLLQYFFFGGTSLYFFTWTIIFLWSLQNLLDDQANKASKQRPGFKTAMSDVRPSADGRVCHVAIEHIFIPGYCILPPYCKGSRFGHRHGLQKQLWPLSFCYKKFIKYSQYILLRNYISRWIYLHCFYIFKLNLKKFIYSQKLKCLN